jgi:hypothetical protein
LGVGPQLPQEITGKHGAKMTGMIIKIFGKRYWPGDHPGVPTPLNLIAVWLHVFF